jgi:hypothetical protein
MERNIEMFQRHLREVDSPMSGVVVSYGIDLRLFNFTSTLRC